MPVVALEGSQEAQEASPWVDPSPEVQKALVALPRPIDVGGERGRQSIRA